MVARLVPLLAALQRIAWLLFVALLLGVGCKNEGDNIFLSSSSPPGGGGNGEPPAGSDDISRQSPLPGVVLELVSLGGASGEDGTFQVGDLPVVTFTLTRDDGSDLPLSSFDFANIMISGPTVNYQRVIEAQSDLIERSIRNEDGTYTYTFEVPIPATYLAPLGDTDAFGPSDGERKGQPLAAGTYTLGIEMYREYFVEGEGFRDVGNLTHDFLFGGATTLQPREVFTAANCNTCHTELRAHGTIRRDPTLCLLCHTSGAEDPDTESVANGTPGVSIDFRVMIHKIHNGGHLPSVLGVGTRADGTRDYEREPQPYRVIGFRDSLHDYSDVLYPKFPNFSYNMPRDEGYSSLDGDEQDLEDVMLTGVTDCVGCHGDPDGDGPLPAPAQGNLAYSQPTARACGSCHDDIDWARPYTANNQTMPPQSNDSQCVTCHPAAGNTLSALDGHLHPLLDPTIDPGLRFEVVSVQEAGTNDGDGTLDVGESLSVTFNLVDSLGNAADPGLVNRIEMAVYGPSQNPQLLNFLRPPLSILGSGPPYQTNVPQLLQLELIGTATATPNEVFQTSRAPLWDSRGAATTVRVRTGTGPAATFLSADASSFQNYIDVDDGSQFEDDDYIVIDDGNGSKEIMRIQWVDGDRLWFSTIDSTSHKPWLLRDHSTNATVDEITLSTVSSGDYSLNEASGQIQEVNPFPDGDVIATYTTDFVVPTLYPPPLNDSPDLGEVSGEWAGKLLIPGTYTVALWGRYNVSLDLFGETNSYNVPVHNGHIAFVGGDGEVEPRQVITSGETCAGCHGYITFHGGGRGGFDTCIVCHGAAGGEDLAPYESQSDEHRTPGVTIDFRTMLHSIHHGAELFDPTSYEVVGFGNNPHTYEEVHFPSFPLGTGDCRSCHGAENTAWTEPSDRNHPFEPGTPVLDWTSVCTTCHNSPSAKAHATVQTSPDGNESCAVCHGPGKEQSVEVVHRAR
ncbi:MAG: hypothetical protein RL885_07240 [Planctomycetota bacterium]